MKPLTETEREAIVPFLELCAERGIDTGWRTDVNGDWFLKTRVMSGPKDATREQYNNLCYIGTKRLDNKDSIHLSRHPTGVWFMGKASSKRPFIETDLPDCDLAAITVALREVE